MANLRHAVLSSPGPLRRRARPPQRGGPLPEPVESYTAKVRDQASRVTDTDVERLKAAGYDEDQTYEVTVSAAVGTALRSLDAGLRAMGANR